MTVDERDDAIDIYLPLIIPELRRAELNYELEDLFARLLAIEDKQRRLSNLLTSAPLSQLTEILKRHDIPPPSRISDGASSGSADTTDSEISASFYDAREGSMNELIPSHWSRTREVSQMANSLDISDCIVARSSANPQRVVAGGPSGGLALPLPVRTRGAQPVVGVADLEQANGTTRGDSEPYRSRHFPRPSTTVIAGSSTRWSELSCPSPPSKERVRLLPATELRHREIGYHGELFVSTNVRMPSLLLLEPLCLTWKKRSTSSSNAESAIGPLRTGPASCVPRPVIPDSPKGRKNSATSHTVILRGS